MQAGLRSRWVAGSPIGLMQVLLRAQGSEIAYRGAVAKGGNGGERS
jgi:hypothetical protein